MPALTLVDRSVRIDAAFTADFTYVWLTGWKPSPGEVDGNIQVALIVDNEIQQIKVQPAIQYAVASPNKADLPQTIGTQRTANGSFYEQIDLTGFNPDPKTRYLYRMGLAVESGVTSNSSAAVRMIATSNAKRTHLGGTTLNVTHASTGRIYIPLDLPSMPAQAIDKVRAAFVWTGNSGVKYGLAYQTWVDPMDPDAWALWEAAMATAAANERRCTGDVAPPAGSLTNKLMVNFGLAIEAASTVCHGRVSAAVSAKEL